MMEKGQTNMTVELHARSSRDRSPRASRAFWLAAGALTAVVTAGVVTIAQTKSWSLPNPDSSNFRRMAQITKANVTQLDMAWFYPYAAPTFSPVFAHDVLYGFGRNTDAIVALDAATGKELWVHEGLTG